MVNTMINPPHPSLSPIVVGRHFYAVNKELSVDTPRQRGILLLLLGCLVIKKSKVGTVTNRRSE